MYDTTACLLILYIRNLCSSEYYCSVGGPVSSGPGLCCTSPLRSSRKFAGGVSEEVEVSAGEVVVLAKYSGTEVKFEGKNT